MNVAPSAASSAGAPGAGVLPGAPAAAVAANGSSFADVLRQLSGPDGGLGAADGAVTGEGGARTCGAGTSARRGEGGEGDGGEGGDGASAAADDYTMGLGTVVVPVALTFTPPPAPLAEVPAAAGDVESADGWGSVTGAAGTGSANSSASAAAVAVRAPITATGAPAAVPAAPVAAATAPLPAQAADANVFAVAAAVPGGGGAGANLVTTPSGGAADVGAPASRVQGDPGVESALGGLALGRPDGAGQGRAVGRPIAVSGTPALTEPALAGSTGPTAAPNTAPAPGPAAESGAAAAMIVAAPAAVTPATPGAQAAAVIGRLMNEPPRDAGRGPGLPRALDGAAPAVPVDAAATAVAAAQALATAVPAAGGAPGLDEPTAAAVAAVVRPQHPGLAAALRAFQQVGAPAVGRGATAVLTSDPSPVGEAPAAAMPTTAARLSALAGAAAEAVTGAVEADRRPLVMPPIVVPAFGGDLRIGGDTPLGARLEAASAPLLNSADGEAVHAQIVQSLRVQWSGGAGEARVRLRPEYLGEVVATVKVDQGTVTATLQADRPEVRRWMEANTQTLRDGLVEHGLKLDRLVILSEPARNETADDKQGRARGRQPQSQPQPRPRRPRRDGETPTFDLHT